MHEQIGQRPGQNPEVAVECADLADRARPVLVQQVATVPLDNQRNLKLAIQRDSVFMKTAENVAREMNDWGKAFFGKPIIDDWVKQLDFTTKIFRARGLHLEDRHIRPKAGGGFSASIVDATVFVVNNHKRLRQDGSSLVLYLPKTQGAEDAALWSDILSALEQHLGLADGSIKVYVLVEQVEQCFQLMEMRAALGKHFIGFNTGRWDYINSVSDAMAWDPSFINPNIDAITMTYGDQTINVENAGMTYIQESWVDEFQHSYDAIQSLMAELMSAATVRVPVALDASLTESVSLQLGGFSAYLSSPGPGLALQLAAPTGTWELAVGESYQPAQMARLSVDFQPGRALSIRRDAQGVYQIEAH